MEAISINAWLPAAAGLLGAFIGAVSSFIPTLITERRKANRESSNLKRALVAEIRALVEIAEARKYQQGINDVCSYLSSQPKGTTFPFPIGIPAHYARIYQESCGRVGEIDPETAVAVITFHQFIDAIVQDVCPGGVLANGAELEAYQEAAEILCKAIEIGKKLSVRI